jgi:rhamnose utilization protein RhaD (predicted bifunctional aldolase and dehydrogenase)
MSAEQPMRDRLVTLGRELGREERRLAILGEGNVSCREGDGFLIKGSGRSLKTLDEGGIAACSSAGLLSLLDQQHVDDAAADAALFASRLVESDPKPSVEALFHAYLLTLPGVTWVGHAHPISVNRILCTSRGQEFATSRLCPDEVVCCGVESVFVRYTDPGLLLARAIRDEVEVFVKRHREVPRVILLANHGAITLGASEQAVLGAMLMLDKSAEIWLGAAMLGGPIGLSEQDISRIAGRSDEHYRRRALNL